MCTAYPVWRAYVINMKNIKRADHPATCLPACLLPVCSLRACFSPAACPLSLWPCLLPALRLAPPTACLLACACLPACACLACGPMGRLMARRLAVDWFDAGWPVCWPVGGCAVGRLVVGRFTSLEAPRWKRGLEP